MKFEDADFVIKEHDTAPRITGTLTDGAGAVVNVTGATVRLHLHGLTVVNDMDLVGVVTSGPAGTVHYDWLDADTDTPGYYAAEWGVTLTTGQVLTFPNDGVFLVQIAEQLA